MNSSIPGLSSAIRAYTSDKLKERSQGLEQIRDIFDSRDNVARFQETASKEGGAGWVAFFQCLFQVVVMEKKAVLKKAASAQADKRLSDAIGLVRKIAEKTYQLLSKKPFMALFTHMVTLLVYGGQIFPPAAIDYIKALKTILSYPPHLECLDQMNWRIVVRVCWASILGDPVRLSENDDGDELDDESDTEVDRKPDLTQSHGSHARQKTLSNINGEIAGLLPILFSAPSAPLISPLPEKDTIYVAESSTGTNMLLKIHRFFQQYPNDNNAHLPILRTLNLILAEMELNARNETIAASLKLLPQIGSLWSTRKKDIREQVVIALRTMLPFVTHKVAGDYDKTGLARETLVKIMDHLPKEGQLRWGVEPLDLSVVRLKTRSRKGKEKEMQNPFETSAMKAGFEFSHESALSWVIAELYADICYYLYDTTHATQNLTPSTQASSKRRRIDNALSALVANIDVGSTASRILHVQILTFFINRYQHRLHSEAQRDIRRALIDLLNEEDANLQSWAMIAFSHLAVVGAEQAQDAASPIDTMSAAALRTEENPWNRVWAHATRKISTAALSRAACHLATCLLNCDLANTPKHISDIRTVLLNIEIQGPPFPYDSVCAFLCTAITIARNDATLYQQKLEDRVIGWLMKWSVVDGAKGKARMDQCSAADIYRLMCEITGVSPFPMIDLEAADVLPDCAIVDRLIEEHNTRPLRQLIIYAEFPGKGEESAKSAVPASARVMPEAGTQHGLEELSGRPGLVTPFLNRSLEALSTDWPTADDTALAPPERVRKALDLVIAASAYLVTLQASGTHVDPSCIQTIIHLIAKLRPSLASSSHAIPGQHLMWTAFRPLSTVIVDRPATWPILLNASPELSGIRKVLFDESEKLRDPDEGSEIASQLPKLIWREPTLGAALKELLTSTESALTGFAGSASMGTSSFQPHQTTEDDFGEIKIAESETMPLSREAIECRRTTSSLMSQLVRYRLCGVMFTSASGHPGRDFTIINAWLAAEGPRFIQLGLVVCDALQDGLLRLNMSAVDAVLETLEEMVGSYGYSRNEGLLEIALAFLGHSAWVWVSPEASSSDLPERAIILARFLLKKTTRGQVSSWRVRLAMILFLDDFLDYDDASTSLWGRFRDEDEMKTDDDDITPLAYMQSALVDIDARVRIRAATSSAAVFLLEDFPAHKHSDYYFQALSRQPGQKDHWDSFMNHLLWKLNCCIASVSLRATAMFHLYEIPPTTPTIHQHFQHGVQAVAQRLHLESIADLFKPYASIICLSQLGSGQKTIMQPFRLYGYPTKAAFGAALLDLVGPSVLIEANGFGMFKDACEASSTSITWAFKQHLPAAAALAYIDAVGTQGATPEVEKRVTSTFSPARPHIDDDIASMITHRIDSVIAHMLVLMDLESTSAVVKQHIYTVNPANSDPDVFCTLIPDEVDEGGPGTVALNPCHSSSAITMTHSYLLSQYLNSNPAKIVFLAFDMLFRLLHETFLAAEEKRYLRCLALVIALFPQTVRGPVILQTFLREIIALLEKTDHPVLVVNMLRWGFQQVQPGDEQLQDLPSIMVRLSETRQRIGKKGEAAAATCAAVDSWLASQVQLWTSQEAFQNTLYFALSFWPKEITSLFDSSSEPTFVEVSYVAEMPAAKSFSSMTLCSGIAKGIDTGDKSANIDTFVKRTFWHLRSALSISGCTPDGVSGLLDLLNLVDGEIHAPSLKTVVELSKDRTLQRFEDRLTREPATLLRVVLISKVAELTHHENYKIRSIAMEVLRKSHQTIDDLLARKTVFGTDTTNAKSALPPKPLLELLVPLDASSAPSTFNLDVLQSDDTWVKRSLTPDVWASQLAILLCQVLSTDDVFYSSLIPLLDPQTGCASVMLPWLVQSLLTCGSAKSKSVAETRSSSLSRYFSQVIQWSQASVGAVEIIIRIVLHLRGFSPAFRDVVLAFDRWLDIDPILLSEAAIKCGAFASASMFLEMKHDDDTQQLDLLDPRVQNIMYAIYSNVEDPDGFYGIQTHDVKSALLRRLQHERQSWRAFGLNGASFEVDSSRRQTSASALSMMSNLHDMGFDHLSSGLYRATQASQQNEPADDPLLLELAWRTGDWDLPVSTEAAKTPHGSFYSCLRAFHRQRDQQAARDLVDLAIRSEIGRLGDLGLERMAQIKDSAANLVCLREISLWLDEGTQKALSAGDGEDQSLQRLKSLSDTMDFPVAERVSATRLSLLRAAHARESKFLIGDLTTPQTETIVSLQKSVYLQLGRLARKDGKLQAAVNSITAVQHIEGGAGGSDEANDEFGHVLWDQKEHALAIQHVEQMTKLVESTTKSNGRLAVLLARNAHWTSVAKMRAPQEIKATFDRAYNMTKASKLGPVEQARVCHEYALFADNHLQALSKSPELDRLRQNRERAHSELEHIETLSKSSKSKTASAKTEESRRQDFLEDERALQDLENELTVFAKTAMKMYATALVHSDEFDDSITRLCSMWLEHDDSDEVNRTFMGPVQAIPSHKFIFLAPQLAARLYKPKQPTIFNSALNSLLLRMARDHPFHVLYQIITVAQGADGPQEKTTSKSRRTSEANSSEGRVPAASELLAILHSDKDRVLAREAVDRMMLFTNAAVPWCRFETDKKATKTDHVMVKGTPLLSLANLRIPPPSVVPPVDLTKKYAHIATIHRYRSRFKVLGGLHRPKRMTCVDSLGQDHFELFKGDDELRQDAVMEQVFEMTNRILSRDRKTKARDLRFRRYTVIPLPNRSGVMEFVGDSQAIGEFLKPAHIKYRADIDHPPDHLRKRLEEIQVKDHTSPELTKRYTELMKKFKPVMRHYFTEKHREPMAWFSMRLNYTRSVAVTSIVGHILGIGDRHCSNILIDKQTGELVHIDFGIVFEDGRRLRIPEKVPFRLTNDIVDGLGLTGVDGTFRQCFLEVFKHDPLYAWAADTEKLKRAQGGGRVEGQSSGAIEKADRVLGKIRQKLRPDLSVEYTVNQLIQEARDPDNLAKIFVGWQPWL